MLGGIVHHWTSRAKAMPLISAFFIIHAVNESASPRKVKYIDDDAVFIGKIRREGTRTYIVGQRK
ncbi:MAG: hypothetical protein DCF26_14445 [Burkholderiales bacterium]|nr:MAG: hypothetical protein DCF26_14445 [Burkholderiales bacterium]